MFLRPFFALVEHLGLRAAFDTHRPKSPIVTPGVCFLLLSLGAVYTGCSGPESTSQCGVDGKGCVPIDAGQGGGSSSSGESSSSSSSGGGGGSTSSSSSSSSSSGAKPPCDPISATCGCTTTAECSGDLLCIDGLCIVGCDNSFECGVGKLCVNGTCEVGCSAQKPCNMGEKCVNGYCVPDSANPQCSASNPCPSSQTCVDGVCEASCLNNAECLTGEVCDYASGGCIPNPSPIPSCGPNQACPGTAQCGAQGYCQYQCTDVNACKLIDSRFSVCDQNICKTPEETNPQCNLQKPCPVGKDCVSNKCL